MSPFGHHTQVQLGSTCDYFQVRMTRALNENDDPSFLLYFSKQCLVENIQGKFQKNSSVTSISEELPQRWL